MELMNGTASPSKSVSGLAGTYLIAIEAVGADIKARIGAGDKAMDKAEQHYIAAGIQLLEAQKRLAETKEMLWSAFLFSHVRIGPRRVRDLIALADGRTTLAEMREKTRERVASHRARKKDEAALRNAEPKAISCQENSFNDGEQQDLRAIIERQAKTIAELKAKHERLQEKVREQASIINSRDNMVAIAERQSQEADTRAMFAEADKERLAAQVSTLQEEIERATELATAWSHANEEARNDFLRGIQSNISDWYVPKHWLEGAAIELHRYRNTEPPEALRKKYWLECGVNPPPTSEMMA